MFRTAASRRIASSHTRSPKLRLPGLSLLPLLCLSVLSARAATVTNLNDSGDGSLRQTIIDAIPGETIDFGVTGTIVLTSGELAIAKDLIIIGPATAPGIAVSGNNSSRVFHILSGATVVLQRLSIIDGLLTDDEGAGIQNLANLTVRQCTIAGNTCQPSIPVVSSSARVAPRGVIPQLSANGGGIANQASGVLIVENSTFSDNEGQQGGGLFNLGTATLNSDTFTNNRASDSAGGGGGIFNFGGTSPGVVNIGNTIVAGNTGGVGPDVNGVFVSQGNNLIGNNTAGVGFTAQDIQNTNPVLGPLADNGGPTQTHALLYSSPAIDAGDTTLSVDQRELPRPGDGNGDGTAADDIGAFEIQATFGIVGLIRTSTLAPIPNVSVQLSTASGPAGTPVTTNSSGYYQFSGVPAGGYLITPTLAGFTFSPPAQSLVIRNASRAANFVGTRVAAYNVSGRISDSQGRALPNISVTLSPVPPGVNSPTVTNSAGYYTFRQVPSGEYTVTPNATGYTFTPPSRDVTVSNADVSNQNFVGRTGFTVTGRIYTSNGTGIPGVTVQLDTGQTAETNSAGYYTFIDVPSGSRTVTPSKSTYVFTPMQRTVDASEGNVNNVNFIGSQPQPE